jgi:hypothetical protein
MTSEIPWPRSADGRAVLRVLKPFQFTLSAHRSRKFAAGEHLLDPANAEDAAVLSHSWICDFADGCIESPQQARERLEAVAAKGAERAQREAAVRKETAAALGVTP